MNMTFQNIKRTIGRGLALAIPLGVVLYIFIKFLGMTERVLGPLATKLGYDRILGGLTLTILSILFILILIFILGLFMRLAVIASLGNKMEDVVLKIIPSLANLRTIAKEKLDLEDQSTGWKPVMVLYEKKYMPAFVIEENDKLITLYLIKNQSFNDGEFVIVEKNEVSLFPATASEINQYSRQYGKGFLSLISK
jgi:uncharacterized membrane protein